MENQLLKVSFKYGAYLAAIYVFFILINILTFDPENSAQWTLIVGAVFTWIGLIVFICMAHYEFNHKNGDYISFKDAICIGLIIIGVGYVLSLVSGYFSYEFMMKEKMASVNNGFTSVPAFTVTTLLLSSLMTLFLQIFLLFVIIAMEAQWKIYKKAGKEGWATLVPIYNIVVLLEIVGKPVWWIILLMIPGINLIFSIWIINLLAKKFGKEESYTIGLLILPFIFYPLLGLSKLEFRKTEVVPLGV
jgi:hypothetical protein